MDARRSRVAAAALVGLLATGCGEILDEMDKANDLAGKAASARAASAAPGAKPGPPGAREQAAAEAAAEGPGLLDRAKGLLGLSDAKEGGRRPPDPNDPMVLCKLNGSTGYMLKSGCVNRRGTVLASKGVPR